MKKRSFVLLVVLFVSFISFSQKRLQIPDSVLKSTLVSVDSAKYSVGDFIWFYTKYNALGNSDTMSVNSYVDKFLEYKLKVVEAENMQLDTTTAFREEFFKYFKMTAHDRLYGGSENMRENLVKQEYARLHWDYEVAHIYIKSNVNGSPKDTLAAWNKVQQIQEKLSSGVSFEECVQAYSDDNLSKQFNGNVGFITAMVAPYEYENALYNAKAGETVSVRTEEGWYFLKVLGKRPTKGAVDAAIILIYPETTDTIGWNKAKAIIDSVYQKLQAGVPFDSLSNQYNLNENLQKNKGVLGLIDNGMPYSREIKETLFAMQSDGEYSKPILLPYGYAIVQRLYLMELPCFEAYRNGYAKRIENDASRSTVVNKYYETKMKKLLGFTENREELERCMQYVDASILLSKWTAPKFDNDVTLFQIAGKDYGRNEFFSYLQAIQTNRLRDVYDKNMVVRIRYSDYVLRKLELAAMQDLQKTDKDFQYTMQEYHDGMIVYELVKREVLQTAEQDTVGMRFFYSQNKEKYVTPQRSESVVFTLNNVKAYSKVQKLLSKQALWYGNQELKFKEADKIAYYESLGSPQLFILNTVNAKYSDAIDVDKKEPLRLPQDIIETDCVSRYKNQCVMADDVVYSEKEIRVKYYDLESRQQTIEEAKSQLLLDYQKEIERLWLNSLKKRHTVEKKSAIVEQLKSYVL